MQTASILGEFSRASGLAPENPRQIESYCHAFCTPFSIPDPGGASESISPHLHGEGDSYNRINATISFDPQSCQKIVTPDNYLLTRPHILDDKVAIIDEFLTDNYALLRILSRSLFHLF